MQLRHTGTFEIVHDVLMRRPYRLSYDNSLQVLEKDSQNVKALYRRAQAYLARQDLVEAEQDIKAALVVDPASRDVRVLHQQWKRASAEYAKKEKQIFGNIFDKLSKKKVSNVQEPQES